MKYTINTHKYTMKTKNSFSLHFLELLQKKSVKMRPKKEFTTKQCMFRSTNLRQPRKFYITAGCDG